MRLSIALLTPVWPWHDLCIAMWKQGPVDRLIKNEDNQTQARSEVAEKGERRRKAGAKGKTWEITYGTCTPLEAGVPCSGSILRA